MHVDMDAFFASVEQRDDPALRGRPMAVGGDGPRGVITSPSYEARAFGVRSAQPTAMAKRQCPNLLVVRGRHGVYREISQSIFALLESITPCVQPLSIDEARLDITGTERLHGAPASLGRLVKDRIRDDLGLNASIGIAPSPFVAKLASDLEKPDALVEITPQGMIARLAPLPVERLHGAGPVTARRLRRAGLRTLGDIQRLGARDLTALLGKDGEHWWRLANGIDERRVQPDDRSRSVSSERTFGVDLQHPDEARLVLIGLCESIAGRLRRHGLAARTISIKVRDGSYETKSRSTTLDGGTHDTARIVESACTLYDRWARSEFRPVRLVGVAATNIDQRADRQLDLFTAERDERRERIDAATDAIEQKFGHGAISRTGWRRD